MFQVAGLPVGLRWGSIRGGRSVKVLGPPHSLSRGRRVRRHLSHGIRGRPKDRSYFHGTASGATATFRLRSASPRRTFGLAAVQFARWSDLGAFDLQLHVLRWNFWQKLCGVPFGFISHHRLVVPMRKRAITAWSAGKSSRLASNHGLHGFFIRLAFPLYLSERCPAIAQDWWTHEIRF